MENMTLGGFLFFFIFQLYKQLSKNLVTFKVLDSLLQFSN